MGRRRCYSLCLVLVLHDGLVHSLAPRVSLARVSQHGSWFRLEPATTTTTSQQRCRTRNTMLSSSQQNDGGASLSSTSPVKAALSSLLAATVVMTGVVPGWEVGSGMSVTAGVPSAAATTFNTEQAAIAETWVRRSIELMRTAVCVVPHVVCGYCRLLLHPPLKSCL